MFTKELRRAGHVKRFSVQEHGHGWEAREEQDHEVLRQVRYTDWHRVERAITGFELQIGELEERGWHR